MGTSEGRIVLQPMERDFRTRTAFIISFIIS